MRASAAAAPGLAPSRPRRQRSSRPFLKGPIPLDWLTRAAALPGKVMQVAAAIWYRAGMQGQSGISVTNKLAAQFAVDRHAKRRALIALELAGLISVTRKAGRSPVVTLLDAAP